MAKLRITFEVDTIALFDTLKMQDGNTNNLGARLASVLMTGEENLQDILGLALYGIKTDGVQKVDDK